MSNLIDAPVGSAVLVVLGAGASFDCLPGDTSATPPLTDRIAADTPIGNQVLPRYQWARPVIGELRHRLEAHSATNAKEK